MPTSLKFKSSSQNTSGPLTKLIGFVFFAVFLGMGSFFAYLLGQEIYKSAKTYTWNKAQCKILSSEAIVDSSSKSTEGAYLFKVNFAYQVNSREFSSQSYSLKDKKFSKFSEAQALVLKYPVGSTTSCYVNPDESSQAILQRPNLWFALFMLIPLIFILIGALGIYSLFIHPTPGKGKDTKPKSISNQATSSSSVKVLRFLTIVFISLGFLGTFYWLIIPINNVNSARSWKKIECKIISSRVRTNPGDSDSGPTYAVDIFYSYEFEARVYKSSRYSFFDVSSSGYKNKAAVVRKFPAGSKAPCYVNPNNPHQAVINRNFSSTGLLGLIPLAFLLAGIGMWIAARKPKSRLSGAELYSEITLPKQQSNNDNPLMLPKTKRYQKNFEPGSIILKPQVSALGKFFIMLFVAVFFNVICFFIFGDLLQYFLFGKGKFSWLLLIFCIPFVLIGIGMIFGIFYFLLALANPRPTLTLNQGSVELGANLSLSWAISGRTSRLKDLNISLEGREEATYQRGTNSVTARETFISIPIKNTHNSFEIGSGSASIRIPEKTMYSFESRNNKVVWFLKLKASIPRWPDLVEEFPLVILPFSKKELKND